MVFRPFVGPYDRSDQILRNRVVSWFHVGTHVVYFHCLVDVSNMTLLKISDKNNITQIINGTLPHALPSSSLSETLFSTCTAVAMWFVGGTPSATCESYWEPVCIRVQSSKLLL